MPASPPTLPALSSAEYARYSRHLTLPEIGVEGQRRLKAARVLCVGAGGLGSPALLYLAAAGVGTIGVVDFDDVDASNLQRQIIYGTRDVGRPKLDVVRSRLEAMNPDVRVEPHAGRFGAANARELVADYGVVVDGTDNFPARYLVNDACVLVGRPNVYGSIFRFEGQASVFAVRGGPCYRCLHPEPPPTGLVPSCAEAGVLGVLPGIIGIIQATEAMKLIVGIGEPLIGRFLIYDALRMRFRELKLQKDPDCPVCGSHPSITGLAEYPDHCSSGAVEAAPDPADVTVRELKTRMDRGDPPLLIDVREPHEHAICRIPGAMLIPLGDLACRLSDIDREREIVLHCRSGARSRQAVQLLRQSGFSRAANLQGGILAWIDQVDPSLSRY